MKQIPELLGQAAQMAETELPSQAEQLRLF
jgi:hypothetical protein